MTRNSYTVLRFNFLKPIMPKINNPSKSTFYAFPQLLFLIGLSAITVFNIVVFSQEHRRITPQQPCERATGARPSRQQHQQWSVPSRPDAATAAGATAWEAVAGYLPTTVRLSQWPRTRPYQVPRRYSRCHCAHHCSTTSGDNCLPTTPTVIW